MTSGSLYFKLLKEDFRRRLWAIALVFMAFFFTLPIGLALGMENAANTEYYQYNDYQHFVRDSSMTDAQYQAKIMDLKTAVVMEDVAYGNGMVAFLMITAAVVVGVSSFAYLQNRKKIDFYHSIPVRREALFAAQFTGGIFIVGAAYIVNLLLLLGVALSYGVPFGRFLGAAATGWIFNMLYYALMYAVTVTAMMLTGNIVVGILGTGVFFFFLPSVMLLLSGYCETFFVTTARNAFSSGESPFMWGIRYLSPFSVYINSFGWKMNQLSSHVPEIICTVLALMAVTILNLELYRKRPSEAAGKAMAFKKTMAPVRILLVLGIGLAGGMFFWMLQSRMRWGIFGIIVSSLLAHCIVEIIYNFDFKKLFSHKLQLVLCLAAGVLVFLSFRYDWYGYDSYIPARDKIASASLEIDTDSSWLTDKVFSTGEDGRLEMEYRSAYEWIEENMILTDMDTVMPIVDAGRKLTLEDRDEHLGVRTAVARVPGANSASSVSYIGGSDGPTSLFIASKLGEQEEPVQEEKYFSNITVCYRLANGRQVRRSYNLPLSVVMDSYKTLYSQEEYKDGLYSILGQDAGQVKLIQYKEAGMFMDTGADSRVREAILKAYQEDLKECTIDRRLEETPVGSIAFITFQEETYLLQRRQMYQSSSGRYTPMAVSVGELSQYWPVYPSFYRTIALLEEQDIKPGTYFASENVEKITVDVTNCFYNAGIQLPEGEALAELQKLNPNYKGDGTMVFKDPESIGLLMSVLADDEMYGMNRLTDIVTGAMYFNVQMKDGMGSTGLMISNKMTAEAELLFAGIPVVVKSQVQ